MLGYRNRIAAKRDIRGAVRRYRRFAPRFFVNRDARASRRVASQEGMDLHCRVKLANVKKKKRKTAVEKICNVNEVDRHISDRQPTLRLHVNSVGLKSPPSRYFAFIQAFCCAPFVLPPPSPFLISRAGLGKFFSNIKLYNSITQRLHLLLHLHSHGTVSLT